MKNCEVELEYCEKNPRIIPEKNPKPNDVPRIIPKKKPIPVELHNHTIREYIKKIESIKMRVIINICHRIEGIIWGFAEGVASGALAGLCVTGAGGWIAGLAGQIMGAILGPIGGAFSGMICGALSDKETMMKVFAHYRENFGVNNARRIAQRSNVQ